MGNNPGVEGEDGDVVSVAGNILLDRGRNFEVSRFPVLRAD